jgi:hypothetical protein
MKILNKHVVVAVLSFLASGGVIQSQANINVKSGLETWSIQDEKSLTGQSRHLGQMIGFDVLIAKDKLLFVPGLHYHRFSILNEEKSFGLDFSNKHHFHYFTIPMTFGYKVLDESFLDVALLGGGEIYFF